MHKILLIEDNEGDIVLIREALKEADFDGKIIEIKDGEAAISYLLKNIALQEPISISLVLLDVNLPKKNGHEVLKFIKCNEYLKHIPVIMLTTSSSQNDIKAAYENAANSFITKPSDTDDFQEVISKIKNYWFTVTHLSE